MGQKSSKEAVDGDGDSNLVEALVIDQTPSGPGTEDLEVTNDPSSTLDRSRIKDIPLPPSTLESYTEDNPAPQRQNLFQEDLEVVGGGNEKGKKRGKKTKEKSSVKRKTPRRRRSARVAPTVPTEAVEADPGSGKDVEKGSPLEADPLPEARLVSGQRAVCVEVDDETNEPSMESETESLNLKAVSDSESDAGRPQPSASGLGARRSPSPDRGAHGETNVFVNGGVSDRDDESDDGDLGAARVTVGGPPTSSGPTPGSTLEENPDDTHMTPMQLYNAMNDGQLSPYLFDPTYLLIVDTRDEAFYHHSHVVTAVHVSEMTTDAGRVGRLEDYTVIVLYDTNGLTYSLTDSIMSSLMTDLTTRDLQPVILTGGYDAFFEQYPFLCCDKVVRTERQRQKLLLQYPSEILAGQLYLGRGDQATNEVIVTNLGITHIVNITTEHPEAFPGKVEYLSIKAEDEPTSDLHGVLLDVVKFTGDALLAGSKVLIHCNLGRSRSATAVIAYLMATRRWTLRDAFYYVKDRRPIVEPNRGFFKQLAKFEKEILGDSITDADELWMGR